MTGPEEHPRPLAPPAAPVIGSATSGPSAAHGPPTPPLRAVAVLFVLMLFGVPTTQVVLELAGGKPVAVLGYLKPFTAPRAERGAVAWIGGVAKDLASADRLRAFEKSLHDASFVTHQVLPWYQWLLFGLARHGTKEAVAGRDGWLFYGDDLASAYGRGFLEPGVGGLTALDAITDFRDQLAKRGVKLLLLPSYSKEMLDPDRLSRFTERLIGAANPDLERFYAELAARKIDFVRMDEIFAQCRAQPGRRDLPLGLPRDTHWSPETMEFAAGRIAARVRDLLGELDAGPPQLFLRKPVRIAAGGDLLRMLGLPSGQTLLPPMELELHQVVWKATGEPVTPDPDSEILLLGDSLANVFSNPAQGMGQAAGLPEQLAFELDRAIDVIALDGKSATGVREALARRPDGLKGKQIVVWQFGVRMLALGDGEWRKVELPAPNAEGLANPLAAGSAAPPVTVVGTLVEATRIDAAKFDYPFALGVMEYKVDEVVAGKVAGDRVWVAFPVLDHHQATAANSFPIGARHRLELEDVKLHYDLEKVSWGDDTEAGAIIYFPVKWEAAK
jgi:acetyltransferase AlgX (SGNH hydrolase-like protein)